MLGFVDKFNAGIDSVLDLKQEPEYMSSLDNWLLVHATRYMPLKNDKGEMYIPTTAMATGFDIPRGTVHFTLNHIVDSHNEGNWDDAGIVILTPFQEVRRINGNPAEVAIQDTYFLPPPEKGVVLPKGTRIVHALSELADGKLYEFRGNETFYKDDNFAPDEMDFLVSMMSQGEKSEYEKYLNADFAEYELETIVDSLGDKGKKLYESASDKKAFLRGAFSDKMHSMLQQQCRKMAVQETAKAMGYNIIRTAKYDMGSTSIAVAKAAVNNGMIGNVSNKGHSNSVYSALEDEVWNIFVGFTSAVTELLTNPNPFDVIYKFIDEKTENTALYQPYIDAIVKNKQPNFKAQCLQIVKNYGQEKNTKLTGVINRWCDRAGKNFEDFHKQLKQMSGYKDFVEKLKKMPTYQQREALKEAMRREKYMYRPW